jgi:hypothetical protein
MKLNLILLTFGLLFITCKPQAMENPDQTINSEFEFELENKSRIEIVDVFDTRQNPVKLKRSVE